MINDVFFRTLIGTVEIPQPLPEGFSCHIVYELGDSDDIENGTAQDFLDVLVNGCDRYSDIARFEDGKLMEVWIDRW